MPTAHCLTVEVQGHTTPQTGVGYMIAFSLPANMQDAAPDEHPCFDDWSKAVRDVVLAVGDLPFHPDAYTRKTALANLMHELADINRRYPLRITASHDGVPAVQIHSTDPAARQIELDFNDDDGDFSVVERHPQICPTAEVREQGRIGLTAAARKAFPFDKPVQPPLLPKDRTPRHRPPGP